MIYLENRNKNDIIFNRLKELQNTTDIKIQKKVTHLYMQSKLRYKLGLLKKYYTDGYNITDYYLSIANILGSGNIEKGKNIFDNNLNAIATENKHLGLEHKQIKHLLLLNILYKPYIGFAYEDIIKECIIKSGLSVVSTESLDFRYKIDILTENLGLQLKAISYKDISTFTKQKHLDGNIKAIKSNVCTDVKYLLHKDGNIAKIGDKILQNKENICNNINVGKEITTATIEEFITELIEIIEQQKSLLSIGVDK